MQNFLRNARVLYGMCSGVLGSVPQSLAAFAALLTEFGKLSPRLNVMQRGGTTALAATKTLVASIYVATYWERFMGSDSSYRPSMILALIDAITQGVVTAHEAAQLYFALCTSTSGAPASDEEQQLIVSHSAGGGAAEAGGGTAVPEDQSDERRYQL